MTDEEGHKIEVIIGTLLRVGVLLSAFVVLVGAALYLAQHGGDVVHYGKFHGEPGNLTSISGVFAGAAHGHGLEIMQLGLLMLIATPVARVLFSLLAFLYEKDWLYTVFTAIVLSVLLYSLFAK